MKRRSLWKDFFMEIRKSFNRFFSIFLIVALGVAFFSGIRATNPDMKITADSYYDESKLMDIRVISTPGLTEDDVDAIKKVDGVDIVEPSYSTHVVCTTNGNELVLEVLSLTQKLNLYTVSEGRLPEKSDEVFVDNRFIDSTGHKVGDRIKLDSGTKEPLSDTLDNEEYTIVGRGTSPYYLSFERGSSEIGNGEVNSFIVVLPEVFTQKVYSTVYVSVEGAKELMAYSDAYDSRISTALNNIKAIADGKWYVLDRSSIPAYLEFEQNAERVGAIGEVFPTIFFLVAALISLTAMTRMVEEQRIQIGTLKALGYSKKAIAMKYMLYALLATLGGSIAGAAIGLKLMPTVIITAYKILYKGIPRVVAPYNLYYAAVATLFAVLTVGIATYFACFKELLEKPAELMRPEAPKAGKRVLLERIPSVWNRLNFTWKATVRNLLRYKKRFFMTIIGIGGCMALLLVGYGLKDSIFVIYSRQFSHIMLYDASISLDNKATKDEITDLENALNSEQVIKSWTKVKKSTIDISFKGTTKSLEMYVPENIGEFEKFVILRSRVGHIKYTLDDEGAILTEQMAKQLGGVKVGDIITVKEGEKQAEVKVSAITENYMVHYLYMSTGLYQKAFGTKSEYNEYFLSMPGTDDTTQMQVGSRLHEKPAVGGVFYVSYYRNLLTNILVSLNIVVLVLIVSAGALAFIVLYNLNNININERRRELATIKVLGFYNKEMAAYIFRENIVLTIIGIIFGIIFGIFLHRYVIVTVEIDRVMFGRNINPNSFAYSILLTLFFSAVVNFVMYFRLKKINMVESLKSVE